MSDLTVVAKTLVDRETAAALAIVAASEERPVSHVIRTAILADKRVKAVLDER